MAIIYQYWARKALSQKNGVIYTCEIDYSYYEKNIHVYVRYIIRVNTTLINHIL